jgi:glycosyltransferase involved in cell wall biosynthesis
MKILMSTDCVGGVWTYALELCRALAPSGVEVVLASKGAPLTADQRAAARALPNVALHESRYRLEWMEDPWEDVARASDWLLELAATTRPDLVHLNDYAHGALSFGVPTVVVGHSCVLSWWRAVHGTEAPASWDRYREGVQAGLSGADEVVAPSAAMLRALAHHYGIRGGRVIHNGRRPLHPREVSKEPLILSAGRLWDEAKNVRALEQVAVALPWPVYLAGEGRRVELRSAHALGRLPPETLGEWLGRASIYALPARYEPFGLSILEAALAGCALVLGDIDSLRELWNGAALFVPPDDPELLLLALDRLIASPALRDQLSQRARARAATYSPEAMAAAYLALYGSLCGVDAPMPEEAACAS